MDKAGIWFTDVDRAAATFDAASITGWKDALRARMDDAGYALQDGISSTAVMDNFDFIAGAEVLYMVPGLAEVCPVHVYPSADSPRAADGKASVSLNGLVGALCKEGDWLMVIYETSKGKYRTGWIDASANETLRQVSAVTMPARFEFQSGALLKSAALFDDPVNRAGTLFKLTQGATVTVLDSNLPGLCYVEALHQGQVYRGFIKKDALEIRP